MKAYLGQNFDWNDFDLVSVIDEIPLWSAPFGLKLLDVIKLKSSMNALDIGSGPGFPLLEVAQRLGTSSKVYGIDPWEKAIERVKLKIKQYGLTNVEIIKGAAEKLPFENDFFDLIVSNNGINNVENVELTLSECFRASKPGAQLAITLNLEDTMIEFYDVFRETLTENGLDDEVKKMKNQIYSKRKPLSETKTLLENSGFKIKNIFRDKFSMKFIDGSTMLNHFLIRLAFIEGWKSILKSSALEKIFNQVEDKLNKIAKNKGEVELTIPFVTIDCVRK